MERKSGREGELKLAFCFLFFCFLLFVFCFLFFVSYFVFPVSCFLFFVFCLHTKRRMIKSCHATKSPLGLNPNQPA